MKKPVTLLAAAMMSFGLMAGLAQAQSTRTEDEPADDKPASVELGQVAIAGSGCPVDQGQVLLADDASYLFFVTDRLLARVGPDIPLGESRRNCAAAVSLKYPAGWTFAVNQVWLDANARLEEGVAAKVATRLNFQGAGDDLLIERSLSGPHRERHDFGAVVDEGDLRWAPCDAERSLTINLSVAVNNLDNRQASGVVAMGNRDGNAAVFGLTWKRCGE